ncbi:MAG TPA: SBBP repeat-containing protein [Planctomycetota bacterium]|nr:SBBP repeat-containing protein [Planctomycetota bacterium]
MPWPTATVTDAGLVLTLLGGEASEQGDGALVGHNVRLRFEGTGSGQFAKGLEPALTRCSYLLGNDESRWVTDVPCWNVVRLQDVSLGVFVDIHGRSGLLEYDLVIAPGSEATSVEIRVEGADELRLLADGSLEMTTPLGVVRQLAPRAWEVTADGLDRPIEAQVERLAPDRFRFRVTGRNPDLELVIDPGLAYGTIVEGSGTEAGTAIAVDEAGSAYVAGNVASTDFPVTPGAFHLQKSPSVQDLFVAKLNPAGTDLVYATYLGGAGTDSSRTLHVDGDGQALIAGKTTASDYPTTGEAYARVKGGGTDGILTKLNASGTGLVFSTYFPGTGVGDNSFTDVAVDTLGRIVLGGGTELLELPITPNAAQTTLANPPGGFIARMSTDGSSIDFCTYVGCTSLASVAVDQNMAMYATGYGILIEGLPLTAGAFQPAYVGSHDAFAMKLSPTGSLSWCTILGGTNVDRGVSIRVDSENRPIVAGWTESSNFPFTPGSFDPTWNSNRDCFIVKVSNDGGSLVWGTFLGGSGFDELRGLAVDSSGTCFVQAGTDSPSMPVTPNAYDTSLDLAAAYVAKLAADGATLLYGTFLDGTTGGDDPSGIAADSQGNAYVTGYTLATDFPTTPGAFDTQLSGSNGVYVVKIDLSTWQAVGQGLPSLAGLEPRLTANGSLLPLSAGSLHVDRAQGGSLCTLIIGLSQLSLPFKSGTMVPMPQWLLPFILNAQGKLDLAWTSWPPAVPSETALWFQGWVSDANSVAGFTATNGLTATVP